MAGEPVKVRVTGKIIDRGPLDKLLVQGELNAAVIEFTLDKKVNGVDISDCSYEVNGVNQLNQAAVDPLVKVPGRDTENTFVLRWTVGNQFTAATGPLTLWVSAKITKDNKVNFDWKTGPCRVHMRDGFILSDYVSVTEQLLIDIATYLGRAESAASASEVSAGKSAGSAKAAEESAGAALSSKTAAAEQAAEAARQVGLARDEVENAAEQVGLAVGEVAKAAQQVELARENVQQASEYAEDAKLSADNAAESEAGSGHYADNAAESAGGAAASAIAAAGSRDRAEEQANTALGHAQEARRIKNSTEMFYDVQDSRIGVRRADETGYTYTGDLTGPHGPQGVQGIQGPVGPTGPVGPRGESGLSVTAEGLFMFHVNADGDLVATYHDGMEPPNLRIVGDDLIWEIP